MLRDRPIRSRLYDDIDLFSRYRFSRNIILEFVDLFEDDISVNSRKGSLTANSRSVTFFACGTCQLLVGNLFAVSEATIRRTIARVANAFARPLPQRRRTETMQDQFQAILTLQMP